MDSLTLRERRNRGRRERGKERRGRSRSREREDQSRSRERKKEKEEKNQRPEEQLLAIGEGDFFVSCLLHLSPEDLKACRLVNKTWNDLIKKRVWGNKRVRKGLEEKLAHTHIHNVQLQRTPLWKPPRDFGSSLCHSV